MLALRNRHTWATVAMARPPSAGDTIATAARLARRCSTETSNLFVVRAT